MADERYITQAQADAAKKKPIVTRGQPNQPPGIAPFFVEEVRKHLERQYGAKVLYEKRPLGDARRSIATLQEAANRAVERGLRRVDKRHGYRQAEAQRPRRAATRSTAFKDERWTPPDRASATSCPPSSSPRRRPAPAARPRSGAIRRTWAGRATRGPAAPSAADLFKPGDLIEVAVTKLDDAAGTATVTLEQTPVVEGALVAIDNRTGQIKAMVGGWNFSRSKFNRAVQAYRQLGSTFKPIVYTAAIDRGFTPTSILIDAPGQLPAGNGTIYSPQNYDHKFEGADHAAPGARGVAQHPRRSR